MGAACAKYPAYTLVPTASKSTCQVTMAVVWALATCLPLQFTKFLLNAVVRLWALASTGVLASFGAIPKSKGFPEADCAEKDLYNMDTNSHPDTVDQTSKRQGCHAPSSAACYLVAHTSPRWARQHSPRQQTFCTPASVCTSSVASRVASSPPCTLTAAASSSIETSRSESTVDSGHSITAPHAVVESVHAIVGLRRSNLRYRSPYPGFPGANARTGGGSDGTGLDRARLHIKIPYLDPQDLRPDLVSAIDESLRAHNSGLQLVGAYVRRGCVELTLDLMDCASKGKLDGSSAGNSNGISHHDEVAFAALVLDALRVPPPSPAQLPGHGGERQDAVLIQRGGAYWSLEWDADTQKWQANDSHAAADLSNSDTGAEMGLSVSAPIAVHAPTQLAPGAAAAGRGTLRLAVTVRQELKIRGGAGPAEIDASSLIVVAKANGRTVTVPVLSLTRRSIGTNGKSSRSSLMLLEIDVACLAAGRSADSPGLVMRLELWRGYRVLDITPVACLADERMVSELLAVQSELVNSGCLDREDEAYISPEQQREEIEQLLGDLSTWLDFAAYCAAEDVVASKAGPPSTLPASAIGTGLTVARRTPRPDVLDVSEQVAALLRSPSLQHLMLSAGRHLLQYFVCHGHVALARVVYADLAPRAAAGGLGLYDDGDGMPLLHRAVRSGRQDMVEAVMEWVDGANTASVVAGIPVWSAPGPDGITALHLLAADACCGASAAGNPTRDTSVTAESGDSMALLRWILGRWPAAVTAWSTARDACGNTPAMLWAVLGSQDVLLQAAVEALAVQVANTSTSSTEGACGPEHNLVGTAPDTSEMMPDGRGSPGPTFRRGHVLPERACDDVATDAGSSAASGTRSRMRSGNDPRLLQGPATAAGDDCLTPHKSAWPRLLELAQLSVRGFSEPGVEQEYVNYVTRSTAPSTLIWLVIMVLTHYTAFHKSPNLEEGRQVIIGGAAYLVSLSVMLLAPRVYNATREPLMLMCLMGRTLCRLLLTVLPGFLHMSEAVQKYVFYGIDILLDGLMEGTFEQARVPVAFAARLLVEWPILAAFLQSIGLRRTYGAALLRAAAVSFAGAFMSAVTDMRARAVFMREHHAQLSGAAAEKKKAQ